MEEFAVVHTDQVDSGMAGYALGLQIREAMLTSPDVVLLFVSPSYDQSLVLQMLQETCQPRLLLGCSSAGEFTSQAHGVELSCALAIRSEQMRFSVGVRHQMSGNGDVVARELISAFPPYRVDYPYQTALVLADALAGQLETFLEQLSCPKWMIAPFEKERSSIKSEAMKARARFFHAHLILGFYTSSRNTKEKEILCQCSPTFMKA